MKHPFFSNTDVVEIAEIRRQLRALGIENQKLKEKIADLERIIERLEWMGK